MPYAAPTGQLGFQVSAIGTAKNWIIADFASPADAVAFVASMRQIDAGHSYRMVVSKDKVALANADEAEASTWYTKEAAAD